MASLATRFGRNLSVLRSDTPLDDDRIRGVAPSIFAEGKHASRSERYAYIATSVVLAALRREGFQPFMVAQSRARDESRREYTKHMIRLRHASDIAVAEANEIILVNSHDGTSSYQELAGMFRFACANGLVCGDTLSDVRVPHKGNVVERVIEGAYEVLDGFTRVVEEREGMKAVSLNEGEQLAFARAALQLKYDVDAAPAPVTERQLLESRRGADRSGDLWSTFNRVQENLTRGGQAARTATGKRTRTRAVTGIDTNLRLNRALWTLSEEMRKLRS